MSLKPSDKLDRSNDPVRLEQTSQALHEAWVRMYTRERPRAKLQKWSFDDPMWLELARAVLKAGMTAEGAMATIFASWRKHYQKLPTYGDLDNGSGSSVLLAGRAEADESKRAMLESQIRLFELRRIRFNSVEEALNCQLESYYVSPAVRYHMAIVHGRVDLAQAHRPGAIRQLLESPSLLTTARSMRMYLPGEVE
jgi:hypothetical protein